MESNSNTLIFFIKRNVFRRFCQPLNYLSPLLHCSMWIVKTACDRLDVIFIAVEPVVLPAEPFSSKAIISSPRDTVTSDNPTIYKMIRECFESIKTDTLQLASYPTSCFEN